MVTICLCHCKNWTYLSFPFQIHIQRIDLFLYLCFMMWWRVVNAWETMDVYIPACFLFSEDLLHILMSSFVKHFLLHVTCRQLISCPLTPGYSIYTSTINLSKHSKLHHKPQNKRFLHPKTSSTFKLRWFLWLKR